MMTYGMGQHNHIGMEQCLENIPQAHHDIAINKRLTLDKEVKTCTRQRGEYMKVHKLKYNKQRAILFH